jgi:membrane protein
VTSAALLLVVSTEGCLEVASEQVVCVEQGGMGLLDRLRVPLGWVGVIRRTVHRTIQDDCLGWAGELAYFFFLALFPALLFLVALASFFPIHQLTDQMLSALARFAPPDVLSIVHDQLLQISKNNNGGLLTLGIAGTIWSASSGMSSVISTLNQAYHVQETRSWWRVRLTAILLTIVLAVFILVSFALVLVGPMLADRVAEWLHLGPVFVWTWKILQWPVVFALVAAGIAQVYYIAPDVQQRLIWIVAGSVFATFVWLLASLSFKWYVSAFANYQKTYGAIGGVIVALLWFYVSGLAILMGAEMNAVIEHASPLGKDPGEKVPGEQEQKAAPAGERSSQDALVPTVSTLGQPAGLRFSEAVVGAVAIGIALGIVVRDHLRQRRK